MVMVTGAYYPEFSGAGLQCRSLIRAAQSADLCFAVVTTCRDRSLPFRDRVDGVPVYRLFVKDKPSATTFFRWMPKIAFLKFALFLRADIIHLHGFSRKSFLFALFGLWPGKKSCSNLPVWVRMIQLRSPTGEFSIACSTAWPTVTWRPRRLSNVPLWKGEYPGRR